MVQLQRDYHLSDEVFWEVFNARVLLNKDINVNEFLNDLKRSAARRISLFSLYAPCILSTQPDGK